MEVQPPTSWYLFFLESLGEVFFGTDDVSGVADAPASVREVVGRVVAVEDVLGVAGFVRHGTDH